MDIRKNFAWFVAPLHVNAPGKMFKLFVSAALIGLTSLIAGCETPVFNPSPAPLPKIVKVTAVGYGASNANDGYTAGQRKLMAMRASKLDAYRALAEQVQGIRVNGNSTVSSMVAQADSYRVYVDAYLRGVQVVAVTPREDGSYETMVELTLDDQFFSAFAHSAKMAPAPVVVSCDNLRGSSGPGCAYGSSFYYSK